MLGLRVWVEQNPPSPWKPESEKLADLGTLSFDFDLHRLPPNPRRARIWRLILYPQRIPSSFLIDHCKIMSETINSVAFVRIHWSSCRVQQLELFPGLNQLQWKFYRTHNFVEFYTIQQVNSIIIKNYNIILPNN